MTMKENTVWKTRRCCFFNAVQQWNILWQHNGPLCVALLIAGSRVWMSMSSEIIGAKQYHCTPKRRELLSIVIPSAAKLSLGAGHKHRLVSRTTIYYI